MGKHLRNLGGYDLLLKIASECADSYDEDLELILLICKNDEKHGDLIGYEIDDYLLIWAIIWQKQDILIHIIKGHLGLQQEVGDIVDRASDFLMRVPRGKRFTFDILDLCIYWERWEEFYLIVGVYEGKMKKLIRFLRKHSEKMFAFGLIFRRLKEDTPVEIIDEIYEPGVGVVWHENQLLLDNLHLGLGV